MVKPVGFPMSDGDGNLLFVRDPKRFMGIVMNDDAQSRFDALGAFDDLAICEIVRYGIRNDEAMIAPLAQFYRGFVMKTPEDRRLGIYRHVASLAESQVVSVNAFLPFLGEDDSRAVVSTATIDYVSLGPLTDGDPMSRVKDVVGMIESKFLENEGAAFGALLNLGDDRVCRLLVPLRDTLDKGAVAEATDCTTGFIYSSTAEFWMDWLEGLEGDDRDGMFGLVASGLALLRKRARITDRVFTGRRPFPTTGASKNEGQALRREIPYPDYLKRIVKRMHDIERSEPPPRIMPHVLEEWGISPVTDPAEISPIGDKSKASSQTPEFRPDAVPAGRIVDTRQEWWTGDGRIFLTWAILNPNGPTLYCLGSHEVGGGHRTYFRWLHMLGGVTTWAAHAREEVTYQDIYDDATAIREHLQAQGDLGPFHIIPNFVMASGNDETLQRIAVRLVREGQAGLTQDWGRFMAYQRRFGEDFFGRAGAEIRSFYERRKSEHESEGTPIDELRMIEARYGHLDAFRNAKIPAVTSSPMTNLLLDEWWASMDSDNYRATSLSALRTMWEGACKTMEYAGEQDLIRWEWVIDFVVARFAFRIG